VTSEVLQSTLEQLRLEGAIFFRSEFTSGFEYTSTPAAVTEALRPGAERLVIFHIVSRGRCWVSVDDGERHWAEAGDVIVVPYGDEHAIGGEEPAERIELASLFDPLPWATMPIIRHGGGGDRTDIVCGYLHSLDPLFEPTMRALPRVFVARPTAAAAQWVQASVTYAMDETVPSNESTNPVAIRLPELVVTEVLRAHLATAPATEHGWLAALRDPVLAPALALLHRAPERKWTVAELAAGAAVSRSLLDERFRLVLGISPIRYLTEWRMHEATELLRSDLGVAAIARRVGYDSEEAFSRAFKRERGLSPAHWRAQKISNSSV
jgi:AraC-like DNA-binding protein